jgi:hypothetical protein
LCKGFNVVSLQEKLDAFKKNFESGGPPFNISREVIATMHRATEELRISSILGSAIKVGDRAPNFILPESNGELFDSNVARMQGPLVISFYRGVW